ncbi:HAD family hydrolase [Pelomonas sp. APW6]|uniref:HAD family hydrolase n=1 Tax=Roseateles subflavus TaxID=3053353 RepID=A0ABT7LGI9_9BURK|nr:HAD family hydrolase [Pelomonas sp. APW6]MDL5031967.1 HAD family hydrolase [Pelomonas sp. APW6]
MTLYVSDLDGTLLDRRGQLSEATRTGLGALLAQGLVFTVASARHVVSIRQLLAGLPLSLPVISSNGAFISDLATGRHELVHGMDGALGDALFALVRRHGQLPFLSIHTPEGDRLYWQEVENEGQQHFVDERVLNGDPRLRACDDLACELGGGPLMTLVVVGSHAPLQALFDDIQAQFGDAVQCHLNEDLYRPAWPWLTVHDRRATKDQAIHILAQRYGLSDREVVVFGDQVNDITMLRAAHRGVAMANAIDEVKAEAHTVIGHHDEDAVLHFLRQDWRPR